MIIMLSCYIYIGNCGCIATITATSLLAIILSVWVAVSTTAIIILVKAKRELAVRVLGTSSRGHMKKKNGSDIDTSDNAAYGVTTFN